MAKPGPKPLPTKLKIIRGTDRPCRVKKNEPKPKTDNIKRPFKLSKVAGVEWNRIKGPLKSAGLLTDIDTRALALYCEAFATWYEATGMIRTEGAVTESKNGFLVQSPYVHVANKASDQMARMLTEFGMTPSSRTRVSAAEDPDDDDF